ncbi:hypothetical protein INT47_003337 [Mucor saturninus]|uniref:PIN domain-containing protein n=1 Tax=Mucor saturninus TaxID=64648 RepID=A0A8H7V9C9_9FUNG|nr:hypothetical protein INT47_003337 [Mucor saturninus]
MSRRKANGRRDDDFNRNSRLLVTKESPSHNSERQLFDPRSHNPIAFNKSIDQDTPVTRPTPTRNLYEENVEPVKAKPKKKSPLERKMVDSKNTVEEKQKQDQRKAWKALVASLRNIETQLESLTSTSRTLSCFNDDDRQLPANRRNVDQVVNTQDIVLVEQDVLDAEKIWKEKIRLHVALGEKYLEILNCDLEYAEKKGLESLCWKRAVYSLVDQFRRALKKSAANTATATNTKQSDLAALLMEEDNDAMIPVIHEGGGMTFIKAEKKDDGQLLIKQTAMILSLFLEYLDLMDAFYQKMTLFLKSVDNDDDENMENYLSQWRRTRKYKWYSCIPLRGDIARYRWSYISDDQVSHWTKEEAFKEAWRRYFLGIWLMPAKGNLYFNLSLLLQHSKNTPGHDFHKLYLSTRSLMVRRNGFLNARESMLVLFEGNRRWIHKHFEMNDHPAKQKTKKSTKLSRPNNISDKDSIIPALFVRLHGMLFTKIGLDEFPKIKRLFFDALFEKSHKSQDGPDNIILGAISNSPDHKELSESHLFWFETVITCLSSLYTYDYASSKLTKLISSNSTSIFYPETNDEQYEALLEELSDSILFTYEIDLTCQIAVELFQRYLDPLLSLPNIPNLPKLPHVSLNYKDNKDFLFGPVADHAAEDGSDTTSDIDNHAWLIYIEILLHWMVLNGICIRSKEKASLWESLVGDIGYDLISQQGKRFSMNDNETHNRASKISSAFWPLLLLFLNKLLTELPDEDKYDMVNKHLMEEDEDVNITNDKFSKSEYAFAKNVSMILGQGPDLPEEGYLRGLGWVDEIHGRFLKLDQDVKENKPKGTLDTVMRRKIKILDYGFTLVKHLDDILYYDPVEEIFTVSKTVEERAFALDQEFNLSQSKDQHTENLYDEEQVVATIAEMDDDVLLSSETECFDEKNEGDDIMTQLKKRREQLQSIVASAEKEERFGYRRLPARAKEREARLNYLRECIIPGKTILVLDTNCFIGHIDHVQKLLESKKWTIIVPLVVVTELDGLRTNPQRLGLVAQQGIELLQNTLAVKSNKQMLRIQTSHNNFMNDISIRSEQFVFGETDKNLDDLILSSCLWWIAQQGPKSTDDKVVPVCLVTGDRNLSVKARARDVEVVPVSAIIQLTPKA